MRRPFNLPLAVSAVGHGCVLVLLILFAGHMRPVFMPQPRHGIEIMLAPSEPLAAAPPPIPETLPPPPAPAPVVEAPPPPTVETTAPRPPPERLRPVPRPPLPPRSAHERPPPRPVQERPPRPAPPPPAEAEAPPPQPAQSVAIPRPVAPSPSPPGPVVSAGYRAALSAWLQEHKRYPESARERGEQGEALLRFRVDRSGRVLSFAVVRSSGYPDLDAAVEGMMRGAELPPFPSEMTAADIQVSLTIRFGLSR